MPTATEVAVQYALEAERLKIIKKARALSNKESAEIQTFIDQLEVAITEK
jgi:hypothetical protein